VSDCNALASATSWFIIITAPSTSALFFFRVRAIYGNNKIITAFFGSLLFLLFGLCILPPLGTNAVHIGTTRRCINTKVAHFSILPIAVNSIFDALVFIAISLRVVSYSIVGDTYSARMKSFVRGDGLPILSKSLLQGGQLYYL
jgi:hypothetical protein